MVSIQLYNTLSGQKETLQTLEPGKLRIYVCGPTVYDMAHVGHARVYVAFDTIIRYLRRSYDVTFARNYTDVDDKIIKRANERGEASHDVSERYIQEFKQDMQTLGCAAPDVEPKVTEHMGEIIELVSRLVDKDVAYQVNGDVYYAVEKFDGYGKLGRRKLEDMEAGARVDVDKNKRHPMDFALWKSAKPGEPSWESPWGKGRPGWHIECSAMSGKYLGETFDIHGGGKDLIFPHHENEIAQSEAATGKTFSRYWMHNGFVTIDDEKMSKSLGNFFTVRDVLQKYAPQVLRFYLLSTHYRSPINFSDVALDEATSRVKYLYETLWRLQKAKPQAGEGAYRKPWVADIMSRFDAAMSDDFNTARAIGDLSEAFKLVNEILDKPEDPEMDARTLAKLYEDLRDAGSVLGLFQEDDAAKVLEAIESRKSATRSIDGAAVEALLKERTQARADKNFARADEIRDELDAMGVVIKDSPQGTTWEVR